MKVYHYPDEGYLNINHLHPMLTGQYTQSGQQLQPTIHKRLRNCYMTAEVNACDTTFTVNLTPYLPHEFDLETTDEWYTQEEVIVCCGTDSTPTSSSNNCCSGGSSIFAGTYTCTDYNLEITCDTIVIGCPKPTDLNCSDQDLQTIAQDLQQLDGALSAATAASFSYPSVLYQLRFCGDAYRYLFQEELNFVSGLNYTVGQRISVEGPLEEFRLTLVDASGLPGSKWHIRCPRILVQDNPHAQSDSCSYQGEHEGKDWPERRHR